MSCWVGCMRAKDVAQVDQHGRALVRAAGRIRSCSSSRSRLAKKACSCCLPRRLRLLRHGEGQRAGRRELEPLVGDDQHRLGEIERGEGRIDRKGDDAVGERDLVVLEAVALAPEQHRRPFSPAATRGAIKPRGLLRRRPPAWPGRARARSWPARRCSRRSPPRACRRARASSRMRSAPEAEPARLQVGPAVARLDQAQAATARNWPWRARRRRCSRRAAARPGRRSGPARPIQVLVLSVPAPGMRSCAQRLRDSI